MTEIVWTVLGTAIGECAAAFRGDLLHGFLLPGASRARLDAAAEERFGSTRVEVGALGGTPARVVAAATAHLAGAHDDLLWVALDDAHVPEAARAVYALARAIPVGETRTYGEIARALGKPGAARAVGQALGKNPFALVVPCHRVLATGGASGGFSAPGGVDTKARMLTIEGARVPWRAQGDLFAPRDEA